MFVPGLFTNVKASESDVSEVRRTVAELQETVKQLERRLEKQALLLQVLQGLVLQTHEMTEVEFLVRQLQIERAIAPPKRCAHCGKVLSRKLNHCVFCGREGVPVESTSAFFGDHRPDHLVKPGDAIRELS
jgi:hypothetical protein